MSSSIPRTSGIYKITCLPTGKVYIGSAVNLYLRWIAHRSKLQYKQHHSKPLQNAWNKYGESAFEFSVIELILVSFLIEREQYWIDTYQSAKGKKGFNVSPTAGSSLGVQRSAEYRAASSERARERMNRPEYRAAVSAVHKGKVISESQKAAITEKLSGKKRPQHVVDAVSNAHAMDFVVTDPNGTEYHIRNLAAFCRDHNLARRSMLSVAQGNSKQHQGWTCRYDNRHK